MCQAPAKGRNHGRPSYNPSGTVLETTNFVYDGAGNLVKKTHPNGSKTIYVGGVYEVDKTSGGTVTNTTVYYPAGGAMRVNGTLYFVLEGHLGSASTTTDVNGNIIGEQRYYPFGETRFTTGTIYTDKLFTGQREVTGLGIYHYGARFYSPKLGRFLSPDTVVPDEENPQAWNRYAYVLNNPIKYNDPTGHYPNLGGRVGGGARINVRVARDTQPNIFTQILSGSQPNIFSPVIGGNSVLINNPINLGIQIPGFSGQSGEPKVLESRTKKKAEKRRTTWLRKKNKLDKEDQREIHDDITGQDLTNKELEAELEDQKRLKDKSREEKNKRKKR